MDAETNIHGANGAERDLLTQIVIQLSGIYKDRTLQDWIPACAGMTSKCRATSKARMRHLPVLILG